MTWSNPKQRTRFKRAKTSGNKQLHESNSIDKLSHVTLSNEQLQLKNNIIQFIEKHLIKYNNNKNVSNDNKNNDANLPAMFVIQGDAGTGKSVVLNSLFNEIQKLSIIKNDGDDINSHSILYGTTNYLVVNHPEMLKLYHRISQKFKYIRKSSLERPTSLINKLNKNNGKSGKVVDIIIVDEGHLLATSKDPFKRFYGENHLEELMSLAKVIIIVYDDKQSLRMGSYWEEDLDTHHIKTTTNTTTTTTTTTNGASLNHIYSSIPNDMKEWYTLKQQFRVAAPNDVLDWINKISIDGVIPKHPVDCGDFDFRIWDDCGEMYSRLKLLNEKYGQCRMLSTYDFPYRLDGKDYFVSCGTNFKLRWDRYQPRAVLPWSERADSIDEVGSVYTIQGFDLNYAGVILGRSIGYNKEKDCLELKPEYYDDHAGFTKKKNISNPEHVKRKIIMNSLNVLLTRGTKGLYVYAYDDELRERLMQSTLSK